MGNKPEETSGPAFDEVMELIRQLDEEAQDAILALLRYFLSGR